MNREVDRLRNRLAEALGNVLSKRMKEQVGRGPEDMKVYLVDDMILVRFLKMLTPAEVQLAATPDGDRLVKEFRKTLLKTWEPELEGLVDQTLGARATRIYSDLDTTGGEMVLVIVLDRKIAGTVQG